MGEDGPESLHYEFQQTLLMLFAQLEISQEGGRRAGEMAQQVRTLGAGSLGPSHPCERRVWQCVFVMSASWEVETGHPGKTLSQGNKVCDNVIL